MRTRTAYRTDEPPLLQKCRIKLSDKLPITVKVLIGQGAIDDVTLAFSHDPAFWLEIYCKELYPNQIQTITEWCASYADKNPVSTDILRLNFASISSFTCKTLIAISSVPFGYTQTYKEVAAALGKPGAMRAVGCACHHNPFPLLVPCHRIVMQDGIGGFAYSQKMKELLLNFESHR